MMEGDKSILMNVYKTVMILVGLMVILIIAANSIA